MVEYRKATFSEVEAIHRLCNHYATLGLMLPRSRNSIYENLRDYVVAVEGNNVLGCGALHFVWDRLAEVRSLAVEPSKVKTGIGREIVRHLEKSGIEKGTQMFFTLTYQPGFFSKCGYEESDKEKLPQKVWKECVYCPQYPYCNELAFVKVLPGYQAPTNKTI
ncbi:MAG: N-acetyltransferase [Acidaminococcaceae bacterium]|jgi:amino-acid N-acetyltransferase|nr:N-acetyltransferase [Acidaminococcaceae bacterium]